MKRQFDDVQLGSIELFCLAAEAGTFSGAAKIAGVTPAAVSRSISRMEERMGMRLFVRTTRNVKMTEAGREYFIQCRQALNQLAEAQREAMGKQVAPSGTLRISVPTTYGHHRLLPALPAFREKYPDIKVDVHISNRNIDFIGEGYDLAIRVRALPDSGMVARHLENAALVTFASPEYLRKHGIPTSFHDLQHHECVQFELPSSGKPIPWLFTEEGIDHEVITEGGYSCSADVLGGVTLSKNSAGIFQTYRFIVQKELDNGSLVELFETQAARSRPFSLIYPQNRHIPLKLRAFIDFLLERQAIWTPFVLAAQLQGPKVQDDAY